MGIRQEIIDHARTWSFIPYRWGGDHPLIGIDCSQFVHRVYAHFGLFPTSEDTTAAGLMNYYAAFATSWPIMAGAVFFKNGQGKICHVGLITGIRFLADGYKDIGVIEAAGGGSETLSLSDAVRDRAYIVERSLGHNRGIEIAGYVDPLMRGIERYKR